MRYFGLFILFFCFFYNQTSMGAGALFGKYFIHFEFQKQGVRIYNIDDIVSPKLVTNLPELEPSIFRTHGSRLYFYSQKMKALFVTETDTFESQSISIRGGLHDFYFHDNKLILVAGDQRILVYDTSSFKRLSAIPLNFPTRMVQLSGDKLIIVCYPNKVARLELTTLTVTYHAFPIDIERLVCDRSLIAFNFVNTNQLAILDPVTMATKFYEFDSKIRHLKCLEGKCFVFVSEHYTENYIEIFDPQTETYSEDIISECSHPSNFLSNGTYFFVLVEEKDSLYILEKDTFESLVRITLRNVKNIVVDQEHIVAESYSGNFKVLKIADCLTS